MSAYLLGLGFRADMGTCIRKLVLLKLIDACEDDGTRIFPAIATIARAAQCSPRQAQREVRAMLDIGLLALVREGGKGPRSTNEYALDLAMLARIAAEGWDALAAAKGDTQSPLADAEKGDSGDTERVTPETPKGDTRSHTTPPDPSLDPSIEREARAREAGETEPAGVAADTDDPKRFEARVKRLAEGWPGWANSSTAWAVKQFAALSDAERAEAERCGAAYLAHCRGKALSVGTYLVERKWRDLPEATLADPAAQPMLAAPFGKLWGAKRMALLVSPPGPLPKPSAFISNLIAAGGEAGERERLRHQAMHGWPAVNRMDELAAQAKPWPLIAAEAGEIERLAALTEQVWTGTAAWEGWRAAFAARGWPWLPEMGRQRVASFPAGGPDGLEAFGAAMRRQEPGEAGKPDRASGDVARPVRSEAEGDSVRTRTEQDDGGGREAAE